MENASKALLIAGSILIGILLLSLIVYIANSSQGMNTAYEDKMSTQEILKFNQNILKNLGTDENGNYTATAQQLLTIKNLTEELHKNNNISIDLKNITGIMVYDSDQAFLKKCQNELYNIEIEYNDYGLIYIITVSVIVR